MAILAILVASPGTALSVLARLTILVKDDAEQIVRRERLERVSQLDWRDWGGLIRAASTQTFNAYRFRRMPDEQMKYYSRSTLMRAAIACGSILLLTVFACAQQPERASPAPKSTAGVPTIRFDSGNSALKIPLDIDNSIIRMQVRVNQSKPLKFIFDTGASYSVISSQRATELGLKSQGEARGNATGGPIKGTYTKGVSLSVQGAELSEQLITSIPINSPPGFDFDGVIGHNFIEQFVVEVDYENKVMNLYDPRTYIYSGKGEVVPLLIAAGKTPLVNTKIILEGRAPVEARLEVDTGADGTLVINSPLVKRQKLTEAILKTGESNNNGAGGEQRLIVGRVKAVQLGKLVFDNPPIGLSQDTEGSGASEENDGTIGGEIFRRFKVILDYSRKRMILEPNKSFNDPYDVEMNDS